MEILFIHQINRAAVWQMPQHQSEPRPIISMHRGIGGRSALKLRSLTKSPEGCSL
jgi:hypothetical protein